MKKIVSLAVAGVAMLALSGCNYNNGNRDNDNGEISKVDILDLTKGYVVEGADQNNKNIELDFCSSRFTLYHDGAEHSGTFSIGNNDYRVNMFEKIPQKASYRIDTADGYLRVDSRYEIKFNGYDILIDTITEECRN